MFEKSFPKSLLEDVKIVEKAIIKSTTVSKEKISSNSVIYTLLNDEKIELPYRIYYRDDSNISNFTKEQKLIYNCIFSRNYDGFIRQKHIEQILNHDINFWISPYIIKISDEYIVEILCSIYDNLKYKDNSILKQTAIKNIDLFLYNYSRMASYWSEFHKTKYPKYINYIGRTLFHEIFGYRRSMEKLRKKHKL